MQDVDSPSFIITYKDKRPEKKYLNNSTEQYHWSLTPSGDLLVYYKQMHHMFTAAVLKDERIVAHANGVWRDVITVDERAPEREVEDNE